MVKFKYGQEEKKPKKFINLINLYGSLMIFDILHHSSKVFELNFMVDPLFGHSKNPRKVIDPLFGSFICLKG